jgi:hypothetical protein
MCDITVLSEGYRTARKDHVCNACEWLNADSDYSYMTFSEKREIVKARRNKWQIKKGQRYFYQSNKQDGELGTFRAIPEINDICREHDLYQC